MPGGSREEQAGGVDERAIIASLAVRVRAYAGYAIGAYAFFAFSLAVIAYTSMLGVAFNLLGLNAGVAAGLAAFAGVVVAAILVARLESPVARVYYTVYREAEDARRRIERFVVVVFVSSFIVVPLILGAVFGDIIAGIAWHPALTLALLVNAALYSLHPLAAKALVRDAWHGFLEAGLVMAATEPLIVYLALEGSLGEAYSLAVGSMALGYLTAGTMMLKRGLKSLLEG